MIDCTVFLYVNNLIDYIDGHGDTKLSPKLV